MKFLTILISFISIFSFAQEEEEDLRSSITLRVYNPSTVTLTLIIKPKEGYSTSTKSRFHQLAPLDTTVIPNPLSLAEDHVPRNEYSLSIFQAANYYQISDHYYWNCSRIKNEEYDCLHIIAYNIRIDSVEFDSVAFIRNELYSGEVYDFVEVQPEFEGGTEKLLVMAADSIGITGDSLGVNIYVQLLVEIDGTVSSVKIMKTSNAQYNEKAEAFFLRQTFSAGILNGNEVRSRLTLPVRYRPK